MKTIRIAMIVAAVLALELPADAGGFHGGGCGGGYHGGGCYGGGCYRGGWYGGGWGVGFSGCGWGVSVGLGWPGGYGYFGGGGRGFSPAHSVYYAGYAPAYAAPKLMASARLSNCPPKSVVCRANRASRPSSASQT